MEAFSVWLNERLLPELIVAVLHIRDAALAHPVPAAGLVALGLIASWAAGSGAVLLTSFGLGLVTISSMHMAEGELSMILGACGILASLTLCLWSWQQHRRTRQFRRRLNAANEKLAATQSLLDREIEWRIAADPKREMPPEPQKGQQAAT